MKLKAYHITSIALSASFLVNSIINKNLLVSCVCAACLIVSVAWPVFFSKAN